MSDLINEFKEKWKEISFLSLLCLLEMYLFSSLVIQLPLLTTILVFSISSVVILTLLGIIIKEKKVGKNDLKKFAIFVVIALVCGVARSYLFIFSMIIAYMFYGQRVSLYKWMFIISVLGLSIFLILCFLTVIPDMPIFRGDIDTITNIRHTFGFSHPNHVMKFFYNALIWGYLWICRNKKITLIYTLCAFAIAGFIYYNTHCRTGIMTIVLTLILMNVPFVVKWVQTRWIYLIGIGFTLFMVISNISPFMGSLLSGRPYFYNLFISEYPIHIFIGKCYQGLTTYPLDNSFLYTVFDGSVFALILIAYTFYKCFKGNRDEKLKIVLIGIIIYSSFEILSNVYVTPLYVLMFMELLELYFKKVDNKKMEEIGNQGDTSN